jgi:hypothetical protein
MKDSPQGLARRTMIGLRRSAFLSRKPLLPSASNIRKHIYTSQQPRGCKKPDAQTIQPLVVGGAAVHVDASMVASFYASRLAWTPRCCCIYVTCQCYTWSTSATRLEAPLETQPRILPVHLQADGSRMSQGPSLFHPDFCRDFDSFFVLHKARYARLQSYPQCRQCFL